MPSPDPSLTPESRRIVWIAILGVFVAQLPINALSVSLTTIADATGATTAQLQWVQAIYLLSMTVSALTATAFAVNFGRKRVMVTAATLMVVGEALGIVASLSGDYAIPVLWAGQFFAGIGAGALVPTTLATISTRVSDARVRAGYIALWGTGTTAGLAFGAISSGVLLSVLPWGWLFVPNLILTLVTLVAITVLFKETIKNRIGLDALGQIFAVIAVISLVYGTIQAGAQGILSWPALVSFAVALASGALFAYRESNIAAPLMDLRLLRIPRFSAAGFAAAVALFSVLGTGFLFALFLGNAKNLDAFGIASYIACMPGTALVVSPLVGKLLSRIRPDLALGSGLVLAAVGAFLLSRTTVDSDYLDVLWRIVIFGIAISLMFSSVSTVAVTSAPQAKASMAGAMNTSFRQFGGALGPAVIGSVYSTRLATGASASGAFGVTMLVTTALLALAAIGVFATAFSRA
ncbi:MFS transporter [Corynebacterium lubricantis]|uniref:MFS transporter n=1 Tax=Corynebacterium lubricantis TaxID=541095 RepID=UPI0003750C9F|nr:MFS transporter [Corynebacterium lubricantis]